MSIQFPDAPFQGQSFVATNGVSYTYDNGGWIANSQSALDDRFVDLDGDTMTGDLTVPSLNGGQLAGFRNQLINGDFRVWQRGEDLSITGSQAKYGPDRWFFRANSSVGASSTEAKLVQDGPISKCRIVYNGTPTGPGYIQQRVETQNIPGLYGKELTFSFYLENVSMSSAPVPTVSITAYGSGGSATQLVDSNNPITSLGNNRYSVTYTYTTSDGTVNDATGFGMSISVMINGQSTVAANACQFWNAQLEEGPTATPFENRSIGTELALCQRYYFTNYDGTYSLNGGNLAINNLMIAASATPNSTSATFEQGLVYFTNQMRATPTITTIAPDGQIGRFYTNASPSITTLRGTDAITTRARLFLAQSGTLLSGVVNADAEL